MLCAQEHELSSGTMDREELSFETWRPHLVYNNDTDANDLSYEKSQAYLFDKLTRLHLALQPINAAYRPELADDLVFAFDQINALLDYLVHTYEKSKHIKLLSVNINNLIAKTITFDLSVMMKNGHEKFNILLIELVNKLSDLFLANLKKISMSKNWFSSLKHLAVIVLHYVFTKFNGFLNNAKNPLLTALYKHLSKANDSYNSSIESGVFKSNFFSDMIHLVDIILTHDNSNLILDEKLFNRLLKLFKFVTKQNASSSSSLSSSSSSVPSTSVPASSNTSLYTYPLVSILHSFSILVSLLKSDRYISSLSSSKKSAITSTKYMSSIKEHTSVMFKAMDTDHKKLKLCLTKNLSDLLVFTFVVFGANIKDIDFALDSCITFLLAEYRKSSTTSNVKSSLIETLIQFISKLNLYYQTSRVKISRKESHANFVSYKFFDIMNIIYSNLFEFPTLDPSKKRKLTKEEQSEHYILINNTIAMNFAIKTLNHLDLIHKFMIDELDNDINKLIVLSKIILGNSSTEDKIRVQCLSQVVDGDNILNVWYAANLLKFAQILIEDLNEFILSDHGNLSTSNINSDIASQLINKISSLCVNKNFRVRVISVETLVKLLRVKPDMSFGIMNESLKKLTSAFDISGKSVNEEYKGSFNDNYSNSYLIVSILSFSSKDYITSDFVLKVFTLSLEFLKKFNTSVVSTNLLGSSSGVTISNLNYEKQLVSWILLLGLFNYASNDENTKSNNLFLQDPTQFLTIWKNLLAHTIPKGFIQIDQKTKGITNISEIMKIIEIKNQSLVCLIAYISYMNSSGGLQNDDLIRQLNQILIKSYTFISTFTSELSGMNVPQFLDNSLCGNKLRIFEAYLKLLPHLNIKNEINSTLLLDIVKKFCDIEKFRYQFKDPFGKFIKTSKKRIHVNSISEYSIYYIDDGVWYGLTSKFNNFKIDELMIKDKTYKVVNNRSESDIDLVPFHTQFLVESPHIQSNLSNILVFDDTAESRNFNFLNHSLLHDAFMLLYNNSYDVGYTDTMKYPVPTDTMTIDTSIELFAISFPHLSSKIQLSVLESIRSFVFYKMKESRSIESTNFDESEEGSIKLEFSLMLRKKAISINTSIAFHSLLNYMLRFNTNMSKKLSLKKEVANLIIETLKNINFEDIYLVNLNSESIGICCSLIDDSSVQEEMLNNQVSIIINSIAESSNPNVRAFNIKTLSQLTKFSSMINTSSITKTIFTLLLDPHPIVHAASLQSLDTFLSGKSNLEISSNLTHVIIDYLEKIWLNDNFGIRSATTISSNINFREHSNSVNMMVKLVRSLINTAGPTIRLWSDELKSKLSNILFNFQFLVTFDYEIVVRELLKIYEELLVFDKTIINMSNYKMLTKLLIINNFKIGVYGHSLSNIPFDDEYDNENTHECFPCTTSSKLLNISLESAFQLFKLEDEGIIDDDFENLLWIALEIDPGNESIQNIVTILLEDSMKKSSEEKFGWFNKLLNYFNISKAALLSPLMKTFVKRINNGGMYFHIPISETKATSSKKNSNNNNKETVSNKISNNAEDMDAELAEAEETLTSEQPKRSSEFSNSRENEEEDDDDDDDYNGNKLKIGANEDDMINILDLSNEQVNWKFKLFIIELLNKLLSFCKTDQKLKLSLSKKIPEFVRISFISSSSNLITLRISSLKLLGEIIELYSDMSDPLYPDVSILDQQQAQIMSTITPSFNKGSTVELAGEGIVLSSKFISSNITDIRKVGRIIKILTTSLENLAITAKGSPGSNEKENTFTKIGDLLILTKRSENKIKIYVLQAWARMMILNESNDNSNAELNTLVQNYAKVLIPLWVHTIREYAMLKYGTLKDLNFDESNEGLDLGIYEGCWVDLVEAIGIVIDDKNHYSYLVNILGDDIGKLFMVIFSLCLEYITKRSNKMKLNYSPDDMRILKSLRKLMKLELSIKILFNDYIFAEFVDIINKLILVSTESSTVDLLSTIDELLKDIFLLYFNDLRLSQTDENKQEKSPEEIYSDFDKLFELLRLVIKIVTSKLAFIKYKEISHNTCINLDGADLVLIKKCFTSFIEMINKLPPPIQKDLYSNLVYMQVLIHELNDAKLLTILLPVFQKSLANYKNLMNDDDTDDNKNLRNLFKIFKIQDSSKENQLLTFIILKTIPDIHLGESDIEIINTMIVSGLSSKDSNLISLSVQTVKSIIEHIEYTESSSSANSKRILMKLIPLLIDTMSKDDVELTEPRLFIEIFVIFIRKIHNFDSGVAAESTKLDSSYQLVLPILVFFNSRFGYESYIHDKLLELVEIDPAVFKKTIKNSNDSLKSAIQRLVNVNHVEGESESGEIPNNASTSKEAHIELKTFG